jgi:hypothetical protein
MKLIQWIKKFIEVYKLTNTNYLEDFKTLEEENTQLRKIILEQMPETEIASFFVNDIIKYTAHIEGGLCRLIAESLVKQLNDLGAENYLEFSFTSKYLSPGEHYLLTFQKSSGLTPHQKVLKLEKELAEEKIWKNW